MSQRSCLSSLSIKNIYNNEKVNKTLKSVWLKLGRQSLAAPTPLHYYRFTLYILGVPLWRAVNYQAFPCINLSLG